MSWPQWLSQICSLVFLFFLFPGVLVETNEITVALTDSVTDSRVLTWTPSLIPYTPGSAMTPYLCVPACVSGPWPSKRSATLHRNSCMLWQGHIETQVAKCHHSPSSNGSASGSDHDVATIRAIARRKKKARLAKKPNATFHVSGIIFNDD